MPADKLEQREAAFAIYRDMGPRRSLVALERELRLNHSEIAVSRPSLEKWSKLHHWVARVREYETSAAVAPPQQAEPTVDPNFNHIDALLRAANQALTRAMNVAPVVTKPSDVKALVDAATNALKLIETFKNQSSGNVSREEVAQEMARVLDLVDQARRRDVEEMVEAELKRRGVVAAADRQITVPAAAPELDAAIEADETEAEQQPRPGKVNSVIAGPGRSCSWMC